MATFTIHICQTSITVDIEFEPETLNRKDCGKWVLVKIELPHGYKATDVDISSIRLEGTAHAELWPYECHDHHHEHGCDHDRHEHHHEVLMVKFKRSEVIALLPEGKHVPVHVTGKVGSVNFEGVDIIRVIK
jgi:large repetitive protein